MKEKTIQDLIRLEISKGNTRLFRNNVGRLQNQHGQWVTFGIPGPGGSDLIGWHTVTITPEMIGRRVAVFAAVEIKKPRLEARENQENFIRVVQESGGIAGVARSPEEARSVIDGWSQ